MTTQTTLQTAEIFTTLTRTHIAPSIKPLLLEELRSLRESEFKEFKRRGYEILSGDALKRKPRSKKAKKPKTPKDVEAALMKLMTPQQRQQYKLAVEKKAATSGSTTTT